MAAALQLQINKDSDIAECPLCSKSLHEVERPKILNCRHVVCLPCLIKNKKGNSCPCCGSEYDFHSVQILPDYYPHRHEAVAKEIIAPAPARIELTADRDCPTCFKKLEQLDSAKILHCGHVVCLPCLNAVTMGSKCPVCSVVYDVSSLDALPAYLVTKPETQMKQTDVYICQQTGCENNCYVDGCYCKECGLILCNYHKQVDITKTDSHNRKPHNYISLEKYVQNKQKYAKLICKDHQMEVNEACSECHHLYCEKCSKEEDGACKHMIKSLEETAKHLIEELDRGVANSDKNLDEMTEMHRKAVITMESVITTAKENKRIMKEIKEKQEEAISKEYKDQEKEIDDRVETCESKMLEFVNALDAETRRMRELKKSIQQIIDSSADHDIVKNHKTQMDEVKNDLEMKCGQLQLGFQPKLIAEAGLHSKAETYLKDFKVSRPQLILESEISGMCWSVHFTQDELLATRQPGIEVRDRDDLTLIKTFEFKTEWCYDIKASGNTAFVLTFDLESRRVVQTVSLITGERAKLNLFEFKSGSRGVRMTLSDDRVFIIERVIINRDSAIHVIKAFDFNGENVRSYKLPEKIKNPQKNPRGLLSLSHDRLLVTDPVSGTVAKYRIKDEEQLEWEWEIDGLDQPSALCIYDDDVIFVCAEHGHKIYVITVDGQLLTELTCPELQNKESLSNISIHEDKMAVAICNEGIKMFKLKWI